MSSIVAGATGSHEQSGSHLFSSSFNRIEVLFDQARRSSCLFFALFIRFSVPGRFGSLFYSFHGFTQDQIGNIFSLCNFTSLVASPLIAYRADASGNRHGVLALTQVLSVVFFLLQLVGFLKISSKPFSIVFFAVCAALSMSLMQSAYAVITAIALHRLADVHGRERAPMFFGSMRLWGGIGWAVGSSIWGIILDLVSRTYPSKENVNMNRPLLLVFYLLAPVTLVLVLSAAVRDKYLTDLVNRRNERELQTEIETRLQESNAVQINLEETTDNASTKTGSPDMTATRNGSDVNITSINSNEISDSSTSDTPPEKDERLSFLRALRPVLCSGGLWSKFFFLLIFTLGLGMSALDSQLFIFMHEKLQASFTWCGLSVIITVAFEVPIFAHADYMLNLVGPPKFLIIGALSFVVRSLGYSFTSSPIQGLLLDPLHGLTFAAMHSAAVVIVAARAPPKYAATAQSVLAFVSGTASVVGVSAGGYIIKYFGYRVLYQLCSMSVLLAAVAFGVVAARLPQQFDQHQA